MASTSRDSRRHFMVAVDSADELVHPCFEGYLDGAWWDVTLHSQMGHNFFTTFHRVLESPWDAEDDVPKVYEESVSYDRLRLRARSCRNWDCKTVKTGDDVSVHDWHPDQDEDDCQQGWYDTKVCDVRRFNHLEHEICECRVSVQYYCIQDASLVRDAVERPLLQPQVHNVRFPRVRILQRLVDSVSFDTAFKAYRKGTWDADQGHWSERAQFLGETGLRVYSADAVEQSMSGLQDSPKTDMPDEGVVCSSPIKSEDHVVHAGYKRPLQDPEEHFPENVAQHSSTSTNTNYVEVEIKVVRKIWLPHYSFVTIDGTRKLLRTRTGSEYELMEKL